MKLNYLKYKNKTAFHYAKLEGLVMGGKKPNNLVESVDRALTILEEVAKSEGEVGVTELGNRLDIHKSTVHRLLNTLSYRGYIEQNDETESYRLGLKLLELSNKLFDGIEIRSLAKPHLQNLMEQTKETVHLVVRDGDQGVYIDKVESPQTIRMSSQVGSRVPLHCTSVGKVLLADLPENQIKALLGEEKLKAYTENTITEVDAFIEELKEVTQKGYAVDNSEHERDVRCVAAPVKNFTGTVIAAISVSTPAFRFSLQDIERMSVPVRDAALGISKRLGFIP